MLHIAFQVSDHDSFQTNTRIHWKSGKKRERFRTLQWSSCVIPIRNEIPKGTSTNCRMPSKIDLKRLDIVRQIAGFRSTSVSPVPFWAFSSIHLLYELFFRLPAVIIWMFPSHLNRQGFKQTKRKHLSWRAMPTSKIKSHVPLWSWKKKLYE